MAAPQSPNLANTSEFKNFVCAQVALSITGKALEKYTNDGLKSVYQKIQQKLIARKLALTPCSRQCSSQARRVKWCRTCWLWKTELETFLTKKDGVNWHKMKSWEWPKGHFKIAEVFLQPGFDTANINLKDISTIFSIWTRCAEFPRRLINIMQPLRKHRNKLIHVDLVNMKLSAPDKMNFYREVSAVLNEQNVYPTLINPRDTITQIADLENGKLYLCEEELTSVIEDIGKTWILSLDEINKLKNEVDKLTTGLSERVTRVESHSRTHSAGLVWLSIFMMVIAVIVGYILHKEQVYSDPANMPISDRYRLKLGIAAAVFDLNPIDLFGKSSNNRFLLPPLNTLHAEIPR